MVYCRGVNYYAIQVRPRGEGRFMRLFDALHPQARPLFSVHFPRRTLSVRRKGVVRPSVLAVFPGYLFVEAEQQDVAAESRLFRRTEGFRRFLPSNRDIKPLAGRDLELVLHFVKKTGLVAGISRVRFDENSRITVTDGPLRGLEGMIVKVDKRKRRAKVRLSLYEEAFTVDLAFEVMEERAP